MAVPDISAEIAAFRNAAYGEDVREALIQLAQKLRGVITTELINMSDTWDSYKDNMDEDWSDLQEVWSAYQNSMNSTWSTYQSTMNNAWTAYQNEIDSDFEKSLTNIDLIKYYDEHTYPYTLSKLPITIDKQGDTFHISGTTGNNFENIIDIPFPNTGIGINSQLYIEFKSTNTSLQIYCLDSSGNSLGSDTLSPNAKDYKIFKIKDNTATLIIRFKWNSVYEIDETLTLKAFAIPNIDILSSLYPLLLPNNSDLNNCIETSKYILDSAYTYINYPSQITSTGFLIVQSYTSDITLQCFIQFSTMRTFLRRKSGPRWLEWKEIALYGELSKIDSNFKKSLTNIDLIKYYDAHTYPYTLSNPPITIDKQDNTFHISGTTANNFENIISIPFPNTGIGINSQLYIEFKSTNTSLQIYCLNSSGNILGSDTLSPNAKDYKIFKIKDNTATLIIRFKWNSVYEIDETLTLKAFAIPNIDILSSLYPLLLPNNSDLNNCIETSKYILDSAYTYINYPSQITSTGFLIVQSYTSEITLQCFIQFSTMRTFLRRKSGPRWLEWKEISETSQPPTTITNEYTYNNYRNEYTVNATPTITTSSNNYLSSTNDTTDRTADILTLLNTTGVCNLGPGIFYVNDLVMPDETTINGSGEKSKIILGNSGTFALSTGTRCRIHNLSLKGSATSISIPSEIGNRHGILISGTYKETETNSEQPLQGMISNVRIDYFTGGGITFTNTGYSSGSTYLINNVYCQYCGAGINIAYWSEFHKFTNVRAGACLYGCINNGGNNVFMNCDFSSNIHGMLMDNSSNQSPNNSHGSVIGCVFNHTNGNSGIGIEILNCANGHIFDGCQIFFSQIHIVGSKGIVFSNCNFGYRNTDITIEDEGTILFANNVHQDTPPITITNNTQTHFINCYNRTTGALIQPS